MPEERITANEKIEHNFKHHPPNSKKVGIHETIRESFKGIALQMVALVPEGREQSLVLTKLEEAMFWANAGVARSK